jgi:hypothetical protein
MTAFVATDVQTGAVEKAKYLQSGNVSVVYSAALPNTLASGDTVGGPILPAGCVLLGVHLDSDKLDSNGSPTITWNVGISGTAAKFISASTVSQNGGVAPANVGGTVGYTPAADTQVIATVGTAAATKAAGTVRIALTYSASV